MSEIEIAIVGGIAGGVSSFFLMFVLYFLIAQSWKGMKS
jgi:hypothetical protein